MSKEDSAQEERCSKKFISKDWFWRGIALGALGIVVSAFAIGGWVSGIDNSLKSNTEEIVKLKGIYTNIDTIKITNKQLQKTMSDILVEIQEAQ